MVARSRSSLMCLQSDFAKGPSRAQEEWCQALERSRQRLKSRCRHLEEAFCTNTGRRSHGGNTSPHHTRQAEEGRNTDITPSERRALSGSHCTPFSRTDFSHRVREEHNKSATPRHIIVNGDNSSRKQEHVTSRLYPNRTPGNHHTGAALTTTGNRRLSVSSSLQWCFEQGPHGRYSLQNSIPSSESSRPVSLENFIPIDTFLACKLGVKESTLSCDRSFTLVECPDRITDTRAHRKHRDQRGYQDTRSRQLDREQYRHTPNVHNTCQHRRISRADSYHNRGPKASRKQTAKICRGGPCDVSNRCNTTHRHHKKASHLEDHRRNRYKMSSNELQEEPGSTSSIDEVEMGATSTPESARPTVVQRSSQSQSVPRTLRPKAKIDADYMDRIMSGSAINMDLLKAPERGSTESSRYTISICREIFMGVIGAQLVYVVTSLMFGNIAAAIIVLLLCVQSSFCHCDGRPAAYMVNGVLCLMVGTTVAIALCRNVSGLEPYRTDPVLHTMSYIYVPLCYLFGCFSFFLACGYQRLHKEERRAIVQAVNRLVGDRYQVNERSLALERRT